MGIIQYAQERHKKKRATTECVWCCQKETRDKKENEKEKGITLSKASNLLRLHQSRATLLRTHAQVPQQLLPRLGSAPGMLQRNTSALLDQAGAEQLRRDTASPPQTHEDGLEDLLDREVRAALALAVEQAAVARPAHARGLCVVVVLVALEEGLFEVLAVDDLHEDNFLRVDGRHHALHGSLENGVCVRSFAVGSFGVGVDACGDVERVEADAEVRAIDALHDVVRLLPGVDVRAPGEVLVRKLNTLWRAQVGDFAQIGGDEVEVAAGDVGGQESGRDGDDIGAEDVRHLDPELHFLDALGVPFAVAEAFVVHEGLQADDGEVAGVAHGADGLGGEEVVGVGGAAGEGFGDVEEVFVEELDVHAVSGGGVEFLWEVVDPGTTQGVGRDGGAREHVCG
jgi:hypothetical protein